MPVSFLTTKIPQKPTIILVGHTGAGKGRLGNWLHDCGLGPDEDQPFDFPESKARSKAADLNEPCTTEPSLVCLKSEFSKNSFLLLDLNILDTAGINDPNDLKNMYLLANFLRRLETLHLVVLVIPFSYKNDLSYSASLPYYFSLLSPLFNARQVMIAFTQVDDGLYQQQVEDEMWGDLMEAKRAGVNSILESYNCPSIDISLPFNTVYPRTRLAATLEKIESGAGSYPPTIMGRSLLSRDNLFRLVAFLQPVSIKDMLFPLPPSAEVRKEQVLRQTKEMKKQIQETVAIEDAARGKTLQILQIHQSSKYGIESSLRVKKDEKKKKENPRIRSNPAWRYGDDMFHFRSVFGKAVATVMLTADYDQFADFILHEGCTYERAVKHESGNPRVRCYDIIPDVWTTSS